MHTDKKNEEHDREHARAGNGMRAAFGYVGWLARTLSPFLRAAAHLRRDLATTQQDRYGGVTPGYLLGSGRMRCAVCNGTNQGIARQHKYTYYRCSKSDKGIYGPNHYKEHVKGNLTEPLVWDCIREAMTNPDRLFRHGGEDPRARGRTGQHLGTVRRNQDSR